MITTPEIDRLTKRRDELRTKARQIESALMGLRITERQRIRAAKREAMKRESEAVQYINWKDKQSVRNETHRLRILLADAMKAAGAKRKEITKAVGVSSQTLWLRRKRLILSGVLPENIKETKR